MRFLFICSVLLGGAALAQEPRAFTLELTIDGQPAAWQVEAPASGEGNLLLLPGGEPRARVNFDGGWIDLNLADVGLWDHAHVLAVAVRPTSGSLTFSATVRHRDEGWDHYADVWRVSGETVTNGVRELLHPHDQEQPFTRSQSGVQAEGRVVVEAADNIHGYGGSTVGLDLDAVTLPFELSYRIEMTGE